ncbi:MAG: TonB-dependent receptor plug domain-containing protein, partial [Chromatocurvus sp.]
MQKTLLYLPLCTVITAANTAGAAPGSGMLEEVTVTAQHREQDIQDVPIAVTAISSEGLKKADIFDADGIAKNVPGMAYAEFSPGQAVISMRGISSVDDGAGLDSSTALFLDGVYIGRLAAVNFDMFDMERIEVLRGPQGTLFGRNSIGGAINVVSSKPTDEFSSKVGVTAGNEGIFRAQAYVSGGLT